MSGRAGQPADIFDLEQKVYSHLQSSAAFIHQKKDGALVLFGQKIRLRQSEIMRAFPRINDCVEGRIVRDHRHRARIDRKKSLEKARKPVVREAVPRRRKSGLKPAAG